MLADRVPSCAAAARCGTSTTIDCGAGRRVVARDAAEEFALDDAGCDALSGGPTVMSCGRIEMQAGPGPANGGN